ncbi:MAG: response regulator [Pseudomonadota bacterium]
MFTPQNKGTAPRERILLVEDDDGVRRSLHLMLHGRGFEVRSYSAAGSMLADPSIIDARFLIADYRLPDSDGLGVRRALARLGWTGRSVLITAYPSETLRESAASAGYDLVLEKPVRQHELIGALDAPRPAGEEV